MNELIQASEQRLFDLRRWRTIWTILSLLILLSLWFAFGSARSASFISIEVVVTYIALLLLPIFIVLSLIKGGQILGEKRHRELLLSASLQMNLHKQIFNMSRQQNKSLELPPSADSKLLSDKPGIGTAANKSLHAS